MPQLFRSSFLAESAVTRMAGVAVLVALLWLAVLWGVAIP